MPTARRGDHQRSSSVLRERVSHADRKHLTRTALVTSCRALISSGADITMPAVADAAGVSEATAYRYFPDLVSLINEALRELWPPAEVALAPIAHVRDPAERIGFACEFLLRRVDAYQGSVRAVIAATITRPASVPSRPGFRFGLIDHALDPVLQADTERGRQRIDQLKNDLSAVVSAEAFFSLTDLRQQEVDSAIASLVRTAQTITRATLTDLRNISNHNR